ncbi:hypothetical protein ABVK25_007847 [Lepraria finkii]|uniref:Uncharacterized protein n=1 Tax=Lepraria finkii TaxID=1340010 RepID=A0ABR4B3R3_9LECA
MIFQGGRAIGRLPQLSIQCLGGRRAALSSSNVERVAALHNAFQTQYIFDLALKHSLATPNFRRTYADQPVSRPKAHTGRTTTAARKAPTTSKTKAAKKPASKTKAPKAKPKAKSKAKPRIKPKPAKKAKAKPKRKVLAEAQKSAATIKSLRSLRSNLLVEFPRMHGRCSSAKRQRKPPQDLREIILSEISPHKRVWNTKT